MPVTKTVKVLLLMLCIVSLAWSIRRHSFERDKRAPGLQATMFLYRMDVMLLIFTAIGAVCYVLWGP